MDIPIDLIGSVFGYIEDLFREKTLTDPPAEKFPVDVEEEAWAMVYGIANNGEIQDFDFSD